MQTEFQRSLPWWSVGALVVALLASSEARAEAPTPGYPEAVIQWGVQKDESCEDVSRSVYGSADHVALIHRYNRVVCAGKLREGLTLVLPARVTNLPDATLKSMNPDVKARPPGGGWSPAAPGLPLYSSYNVNTLEAGRADIEFVDRTRVFLAPNTLVVIYGTASQSKVAKTPPVAMEVQAGEIKAGLAALRGESIDVGVEGGGRVSAASRDAVVQKKGDRTTVEVFDGTAKVASAGATVNVPTNFGTRFFRAKAPAPPRPLPDAPTWQGAAGARLVLTDAQTGTLASAWDAVSAAASYRVEVARDAELRDYVVREEVPQSIHALRAEKLPLGTYYATVRAIDKEDYLGIAAKTLIVHVVHVELEGPGRTGDGFVEVSPYGRLKLGTSANLELAIDDGPFGAVPPVLDVKKLAPKKLRLRGADGSEQALDVRYVPLEASLAPSTDKASSHVEITLKGAEGLDVARDVGLRLVLRAKDGAHDLPIAASPNALGATFPAPIDASRVDLLDGSGKVLGSAVVPARAADAPAPPPKEVRYPVLGATAPLWIASAGDDLVWFAPTAQNAAAVSGLVTGEATTGRFEGRVRASGSVGALGLDASIGSDTLASGRVGATAWFGGRARALRLGLSELELAPSLRLGLPVNQAAPPARLEPGLALGSAHGLFTWVLDLGGRIRLKNDESAAGAPPGLYYAILGGTYDLNDWMRAHTAIDAATFQIGGQSVDFRSGLTLGLEAGKTLFAGAGVRLSPWHDAGAPPASAQLAIGVREAP